MCDMMPIRMAGVEMGQLGRGCLVVDDIFEGSKDMLVCHHLTTTLNIIIPYKKHASEYQQTKYDIIQQRIRLV